MFLKNLNISEKEKATFKLHLAYSLIEGFLTGVFILNEFIFIKSLHGSNYELSVLFQFSVVVLIISVFTNQLMESLSNKKILLRIIALITRLPLVVMIFIPARFIFQEQELFNYYFLFAFFMYYLASPVILPSLNLLLKNNYSSNNFGKLYSIATSMNKVVMLLITFLFGLLLDYDHFSFRYIYAFSGFLGIISIFLLTQIDDNNIVIKNSYSYLGNIRSIIIETLKTNKAFRDFQISLVFYGFGFMSTVTIITIFYEVVLQLNYTSVAFYKNVYNILAILLLPFFGRLISRIDQRRFSIISIASLLFYVIFVMLTEYFSNHFYIFDLKIYYMLLIAVVFHAFFAATMSLSWSIGSAYFCKTEEAGMYQSVHLSITGLRGLIFPIIGVALYERYGFTVTYITASISLLAGILILFYSERRVKFQKKI